MMVVNRHKEFKESLIALKSAMRGIQNCHLLILQQGNDEIISAIISEINWIEKTHLILEYPPAISAKGRINGNLRYGLFRSFEILGAELVSVIEDDIVVADDFLVFAQTVYSAFAYDPDFMGVNSVSGVSGTSNDLHTFGKFRYSFLWGWSIPKSTWRKMSKKWTGLEDRDWDSYVEPFVKRGYVVMPRRSRVLNIGFNQFATHTRSGDAGVGLNYESLLQESFAQGDLSNLIYEESKFLLNWRNDCVPFLNKGLGSSISSAFYVLLYFFSDLNWARRHLDIPFLRRKVYGFLQYLIPIIQQKISR